MHQTVLIEDLAVVLCIAGIVTILFQKIKQPIVLGYLLAGIIIGPYTPPFSLIDDAAEIRLLAELGVIFLMFSLGLEFTFSKLTRLGLPALIIGTFEVVFMVLLGFYVGQFLGWSPYERLLLGAALAISSTTIIVKALEEFNLKRLSFADLMIGVLLIEDLLAILLLVYISTAGSEGNILSHEILYSSLKLLSVVTSWFLIGYFALPYVMRKIQKYINLETLTIISIGLCLFLSSVAIYFDYSAALGAFIMGAILAETPLAQKIAVVTLPIRDVFAAVFFVSVGMLIDPIAILNYWHYILLLSIVTVFGKILASGGGALLAGQTIADSIRIGFSMAQIGEFSFIIIGIGSTIKTTDDTLYPIIVAIAAITTFVTPYLMKLGLKISDQAEEKIPIQWLDQLKKYHHWLSPPSIIGHKEKKMNHKRIPRFILNGIIIAIIATVSAHVVIPQIFPAVNKEWPFQLMFWLIIAFLSSPFIWAMLFAHRTKGKTRKIERAFIGLLTVVELCGLAFLYLTFPILMIPLALFLIVYFMLFFHNIKTWYAWLENQLIYNLTRKYEIDKEILQKLAPWEHELVSIKVSNHFPFIGQSLEECRLRPSFGINIVAIKRALKTLWLPSAQERILPDDELVILGEKTEIDNFREFAQHIENDSTSSEQPELNIQAVLIDNDHILNHHHISDRIVKEHLHGLIVGLEREGQHILNPPPSTRLKSGDILLFISKKE